MVSSLTSGFLPLFGGAGAQLPDHLYLFHTRVTVRTHTNSHPAMSVLALPAFMCLMMSALFSSDVGWAICNRLLVTTLDPLDYEKLNRYRESLPINRGNAIIVLPLLIGSEAHRCDSTGLLLDA
jgi:hypothetical protein